MLRCFWGLGIAFAGFRIVGLRVEFEVSVSDMRVPVSFLD